MKIRWSILLIVVLMTFSCAQEDASEATNKAISDRLTEEVWNGGNLDLLDDFIAENYVRHNPASVDPPVVNGRDEMKEYITSVRTTYPDFHVEVYNRLAEGDLVAGSWTVTGTNAEVGVAVENPGISISRYQDGKVVEEWVSWDTQSMTNQLAVDSETDTED